MRSPSPKVEDQGSDPFITPEPPTKPALPTPLWQRIGEMPLVQKVKIVEAASYSALAALKDMINIMTQHENSDPAVKFELSSLTKVLEQKKENQIYIGFLGCSGAGKSSLINALLSERNILPISHEEASTSVIVEISYNTRSDYHYVAEVLPMEESEIRKELKQLFEDKKAWDAQEKEEDDEVDPELKQRMEFTFDKYICVFKRLRSLDALKNLSVEELLEDSNAKNMLGQRRIIEKSSLREFSKSIKPFIDKSKQVGDEFAYSLWPLVKVVKLYIKADILKTGIVLVDLPGSHDTSTARSQMAAQYMKNLALCCVTADAKRAATDKGAKDTLNDVRRRTMQLDGLYLKDSIFFIITAIDASIEPETYINDHPELDRAILDDVKLSSSYKGSIAQLDNELKDKDSTARKLEKILQQCDERLAARKAQFEQIISQCDAQNQNKKRKRGAAPSAGPTASPEDRQAVKYYLSLQKVRNEQHDMLNKENVESLRMHTKKENYTKVKLNADFRIMNQCIANRKKFQINAITKDYETARKEISDKKSHRPLPVYCVSAVAFKHLVDGNEAKAMEIGFKTKADTGIPGLRDGLISTTWEPRLKNGLAFNEELHNAFARLEKWLEDTKASFKMTAEERVQLDGKIAQVSKNIDESFAHLHITIGKSAEQVIEKRLLSGFPKISKQAAAKLRKRVTKTVRVSKPIIWSTHRALNKSYGIWESSHAGLFDWNEEIHGEFVDIIKKKWAQTFHVNIPTVVSQYIQEVEKRLTDYADNLMSTALGISPSLRKAFEYLHDSALRNVRRLKTRADAVFANFDTAAKDAWRLVKPICEEAWMPIYEKCGAEKGKGLYARNKATHKKHLNGPGGKAMYEACCNELETALRRMCGDLHSQFEEKYREIMQEFKDEMTATLDQHTMGGDRRSDRQKTSLTKVKLQKILPSMIEALYKDWQAEPSDKPKEDKTKPNDANLDSDRTEAEEDAIPDIDDLMKDRNFNAESDANDSGSDE
ncbi:hypothetical protein BCON_0013g00630 [Botryotinia convoluta]|uniref:G domain-containing protein n=1 Tax=Botryotinia convoluta TaxID=54673 RepID=A0A4Z1J3H4_9HELO|nr:hypothetical protein BCON_0013g00630 [Botryotinia convoluta]